MAQAQTLFVADDGKSFATLEEATAHEDALRVKAKLGEYGAAAKMSKAQLTHLEKHLAAFHLFFEHGVMPVVPEKRPGRPKKDKASTAA